MKVASAIAWLGSLPPDAEVDVTVRPPAEDELFRPMTDAERAREYRRRKRDGVTKRHAANVTIVTEGVGGGLSDGSENQAEEQGEDGEDLGTNLSGLLGAIVTPSRDDRDAQSVFEFWRADTNHPRAAFDRKRMSRIAARLREGFTVERLCAAIRNRRNDPFLMGSNDTGRVFDGIETVLRDAAQVERLEALTKPAVPAPSGFKSAGTLLMERSARIAAEEGEKIPTFPLFGGSR